MSLAYPGTTHQSPKGVRRTINEVWARCYTELDAEDMKLLCAALLIAILAGCAPNASSRTSADAEKAKTALLELMRSKASPFEGADPLRFEKIEVKNHSNDEYTWGAFIIYLNKKRYSAEIVSTSAAWFYNGRFSVDSSGKWKAETPEKLHAIK